MERRQQGGATVEESGSEGNDGVGCDGSMVEGVALGGGDGSEAAAHSPENFSGGRKTPWRRRIFEG
ncbi:hypothetical protein Tco_0636426, partial [Tanacetum coccineum]